VPAKVAEEDSNERLALAHFRLGSALIKEGRAHRADGVGELRRAIELDPGRLESHLYLAEMLYREGQWLEAATEYRKATTISPASAAAHNGLGLALDKLGLKEQAGAEFVKATDLEPTNASYRANLVAMKSRFSNERIAVEPGTLAKLTPP
jgi:Tfp pilus assembly protein PilF